MTFCFGHFGFVILALCNELFYNFSRNFQTNPVFNFKLQIFSLYVFLRTVMIDNMNMVELFFWILIDSQDISFWRNFKVILVLI